MIICPVRRHREEAHVSNKQKLLRATMRLSLAPVATIIVLAAVLTPQTLKAMTLVDLLTRNRFRRTCSLSRHQVRRRVRRQLE